MASHTFSGNLLAGRAEVLGFEGGGGVVLSSSEGLLLAVPVSESGFSELPARAINADTASL